MDIHSSGEWERLGNELRKRRGELGYGSRERKRFAGDSGLHYRLVQRIETGEREGYPPETIAQVESAYRLERDAIGAFFTTGHLAVAASAGDEGPVRLTARDDYERTILAADADASVKATLIREHRERIESERQKLRSLGLDGGPIVVPDLIGRGIDRLTRGADADDGHGQDAQRA